MKKKSLFVSTVALATASAMVFSPVSYKVIDKAVAAEATPASDEVKEVSALLTSVFAELNTVTKLKDAYDDMLNEASQDVNLFKLAEDLPKFSAAISADIEDEEEALAHIENVQEKLKAVFNQIVLDYGSSSVNLGDLSPQLETAIEELSVVLGTEFNRTDVAKLLLQAQTKLLTEVKNFDITDEDFTDTVITAVKEAVKQEWNKTGSGVNSVVAYLKGKYASFDDFDSDYETLKANHEVVLEANPEKKQVYKDGAVALGASYLKAELKKAANAPIKGSATREGNGLFSFTSINVLGNTTLPLSAFDWTTNLGEQVDIKVYDDEDGVEKLAGKLVLDLSNVQLPTNIVITASFKSGNGLIPTLLNGVELFSQSKSFSNFVGGGGDIVEEGAPLQLVSDAQAKADAISGNVGSYLEDYADLRNNSERFGLKAVVENGLREALLVQAAGSVSSSGVFSPTIAQMENIYNSQLTPVLNAAKAALTENGVEVDIEPVLTFNIGIVTNGQVNLSKALIDSLISKGVASVGVKTGDTVIEVPLAQLTGAATINVKKTGDVYSISVVDASGNALTAFEKQYRVTLPVNGNVDEAAVTVAKLDTGSVTHIGGAYYSDTDTITFYANQLGEYSVVENSPTFNDIANLDWANLHIQFLANQGILLGKADGVFDPKGTVTRAEFTAMIVRSFNLSLDGTGVSFNDVNESAWYHGAVEAAVAYGIVNGRSTTSFDPNAQITRDEMATMAANALKEILGYVPAQNAADVLAGFVDGSSVVPAHTAGVALLADEEIVNGRPDGSFDPKGNASRAEAAVIILNALSQRN